MNLLNCNFRNLLLNSVLTLKYVLFFWTSTAFGQIPVVFIEDVTGVYGDRYYNNLKGKPKVIIERDSDDEGILTLKYDENGNLINNLYELEDPDGIFCPKRFEGEVVYNGKMPVKIASSRRCNLEREFYFETSSGHISNSFEFYMPKSKDNYILHMNHYGYNYKLEKYFLERTVSVLVKSSDRKIKGTDLVVPNYDIADTYSFVYDDKYKLKKVYQIDKKGDTLRLHTLDNEGRIKNYMNYCPDGWESETLKGCFGIFYEYGKDGLSAFTEIESTDVLKKVFTCLKYDEKGNWTEQNVKISKNGKQTKEYVRYRTITYYE